MKWKHFPRYWPFVRGIQRLGTRSFDVFLDLRLYKRLSKQSWGWWFETPSLPLWRHRNVSSLALLWLHEKSNSCGLFTLAVRSASVAMFNLSVRVIAWHRGNTIIASVPGNNPQGHGKMRHSQNVLQQSTNCMYNTWDVFYTTSVYVETLRHFSPDTKADFFGKRHFEMHYIQWKFKFHWSLFPVMH